MKNLCGKCNVCCTALRIDKSEIFWKDEDKASNQTCEKLKKGKCSVYKKRPEACRKYECLWLQISKKRKNFSTSFRPDKSKLLVTTKYYPDTNIFVFEVKETEENVLDFDDLDSNIDNYFKVIFDLAEQQKGIGKVIISKYKENVGYELKNGR